MQSCPTTQDVASVAEILGDFAREFKEVLALHATGAVISKNKELRNLANFGSTADCTCTPDFPHARCPSDALPGL